MRFKTVRTYVQHLVRQRSGVALAVLGGLIAFGAALAVLSFDGFGLGRSAPPTSESVHVAPVVAQATAVSGESLAAGVLAGHTAVGVRLKADSVPLAQLHVGSVIDVLMTLADGPDGPGLVGPVVTGARVVAVTPGSDYADVLLDAPAEASMLLGHLVRRGLPLTYTVRQVQDEPGELSVVTLDETRARLALPARVTPVAPSAASVAAAPTQPAPALELPAAAAGVSEVHFVVYSGVDLDVVEQRFDVTEGALRAANPQLGESDPLTPGMELVVPDLFGFYYSVQSDDTLDNLSQRFHVSPEQVRRVNDLPLKGGLPVVGDGLLMPAARPAWAMPPTGQ